MKENRFQRAVKAGQVPKGHMIMEFGTRGLAKILEAAGLDYVILDMEHTGFDTERIADLVAWFKATDIAPFVRIPQSLYHFVARTLDAGALGIMAGNVETPEQARLIVDAAKFSPMGKRGVGLGTAHNDFLVPAAEEYFDYSNRNTTIICQIESELGLSNLDAIAQTPGVDILWVGHYDLSQSMGICAQFQHPRFLQALQDVVDAARRHGKLSGIQPGNLEQAEQWLRMGYDVLSWKTDLALYRIALQNELQQFQQLAESIKRKDAAAG